MFLLSVWLGLLALMLRNVVAASAVWRDPDTGLSFASDTRQYKVGTGQAITFRVAVPGDAQPYTNYDIVVQIVAPSEVGWAGLAWGGSMARNPLFVVWKATDSKIVTASSRWSNGHFTPTSYTGAQYTVFKSGTKSNNTHWQITAKCSGCATWTTPDGGTRYLSPRGGNRLAMAYSPTKPSQPNSNTSTIQVHDVHDYWSSEFNLASNANFATIVQSLQTL